MVVLHEIVVQPGIDVALLVVHLDEEAPVVAKEIGVDHDNAVELRLGHMNVHNASRRWRWASLRSNELCYAWSFTGSKMFGIAWYAGRDDSSSSIHAML